MERFDEILRDKLDQLKADQAPQWDSLNQQLEGEAFDSLLQQSLVNTPSSQRTGNVVPMVTGWDMLNDKLNAEAEIEGDVFDRIFSQKLAEAETAVPAAESWGVLSHRMDTAWTLRRKLVRYRALEIAAAIALLLTFAPLLRDNPVWTSKGGEVVSSKVKDNSSSLHKEHEPSLINGFNAGVERNNVALTTLTGQESLRSRERDTKEDSNQSFFAAAKTPVGLLQHAYEWITSSSDIPIGETQSGLANSEEAMSSGTEMQPRLDRELASMQQEAGSRDLFTAKALNQPHLEEIEVADVVVPSLALPITSVSRKGWRVGIDAGVESYRIATPKDQDFDINAFSRRQGGLTAGAHLIRKLGNRTELSLGGSIAPVVYDPNFPTVLDEVSTTPDYRLERVERFNTISLNLVKVPVELRYQLNPRAERTRVFAKAGVVGNFALQTDYDLDSDFRATSPQEAIVSGPTTIPNSSAFGGEEFAFYADQPVSEVKEFPNGILEDGFVDANTYLTARLGIEAEYLLNKRISLFSGVDFNQFVPLTNGVGPNEDKLNSVGLKVGARVQL